MCLIAHRTKPGSHIPNKVVEYNKLVNPDGFGLMWRDGDEVKHAKYAPDEFELFRNQLKALDITDVEYAAHWRNATEGAKDRDMAHPYLYHDLDGTPITLMHNGIINIIAPKGWSDTAAFADQVLARMRHGWWHDPALRFLVEQSVGWSRLLLFTPHETVTINEPDWHLDDAIRYSTKALPSYKPWTRRSNFLNWHDDDDDWALPPTKKIVAVGKKGEDEDEDEETFIEVKWLHGPDKHLVVPTDDVDVDKAKRVDLCGDAMCLDCEQEGEYYIIDGNTIIDLQHVRVDGILPVLPKGDDVEQAMSFPGT